MFFQCFSVGGSAVAFVAVPSVLWEFLMEMKHVFVAVSFGQDAGGGDGGEFSVPFDDALVADFWVGFETVAIDQQKRRFLFQRGDGPVHGQEASLEDVDRINLLDGGGGDREGQGFFFDEGTKDLPVLFADLFGIVQQGVVEVGWKDHGRGENRSGIAASAGLVAAGFAAFFL